MKRAAGHVVLVFLAGGLLCAQDRDDFRDSYAYHYLLQTDTFGGIAVGYSGDVSDEVSALRALLRRPDARQAMHALWENAGTVGRLYAVCGMWFADPAAFHEHVRMLEDSNEVINDQRFGCIVSRTRVGDLVSLDDPFAVRLDHPGQTLGEWARSKGLEKTWHRYLTHDVIGGGFPASFSPDRAREANLERERTLEEWIAILDDRRSAERYEAAHALLTRHGNAGVEAVYARLDSADSETRGVALEALTESHGSVPAVGVPSLVRVLRASANEETRYSLLALLARSDPTVPLPCDVVKESVRELLDEYDEDSGYDDHELAQTLAEFNSLDPWGEAASRLLLAKRCGKAVRPLVQDLLSVGASGLRESVFHFLLDQREAAPAWVIDELIQRLDDPRIDVRVLAAACLGNCGERARMPAVLKGLRRRLGEGERRERAVVALALERITADPGAAAEHVLAAPDMWQALFPTDEGLIELALSSIAAPRLLTDLASAVEDYSREERIEALQLIAKLGPSGAAAAPALTRLADADDTDVGMAAARALWKVSGEAGPYLRLAAWKLGSQDYAGGLSAVRELGPTAAPLAAGVGRLLEELIRSERRDAVIRRDRRHALHALGDIGEGASSELPLILQSFGDEQLWSPAEKAAVRVDPTLTRVGPAIRRLLASEKGYVRAGTVRVLAECSRSHARPFLEAARKDPSPAIRWAVERLLAGKD